jgi:hypothetical protein
MIYFDINNIINSQIRILNILKSLLIYYYKYKYIFLSKYNVIPIVLFYIYLSIIIISNALIK